ncbi:MAG: beta-galactosidase, partial [Armatimonadota bacterium]
MASPPQTPALRQPLFWAYGLREVGDLAAYRRLGLNTVYIDLPAGEQSLDPVFRQFIRAAAAYGLQAIIGIPTALGREQGDERDPTSPYNEQYVSAVDQFVQAVVRTYQDEPAVIGWATEHNPSARITYSDADFQQHLQEHYATVADLKAAWGSQFGSFRSVHRADVQSDADEPFAIGRRSLALAEYERAAFADLHKRWLMSIRRFDDTRPIFTGRLRLYRSLASVPTDYTCIVPDATGPPVMADQQTQGAERIVIARRGGRCEAIPCVRLPISVRLPPPLPAQALRHPKVRALEHIGRQSVEAPRLRSVRSWLSWAALNGARGVAFASWERLRDESQGVHELVRSFLTDPDSAELFTLRPQASAAVLYEPYEPVVSERDVGFYGYLRAPGDMETATLLSLCRLPSTYGATDVLALDDLEALDLSRYGVIVAPRAYNLPRTAQEKIERYVEGGGAFVADLGVGLFQAGSWSKLPPRLMALFGIEEIVRLQNTYRGGWQAGNGFVGTTAPEFAS